MAEEGNVPLHYCDAFTASISMLVNFEQFG
jgi:hypothetical protein